VIVGEGSWPGAGAQRLYVQDSMERLDTALLTPSDVALRLGVSRSWLYAAAKAGRVPCVRLGGNDGPLRFVEADLVAWLGRARRVTPENGSVGRATPTAKNRSQRPTSRRVGGNDGATAEQLAWPMTDHAGGHPRNA
jgi:excisionase family DNA binding protein